MDRIKLEQLICDNMKSIFGFALTRLGNAKEAEELASDILYEILRSAHNLQDEERFWGFMWRIAENTYMDYLRKKSRASKRTAELNEGIPDESDLGLDQIVQAEELNLLRRELSLLSKQYRDATVLYYMENLSCSEIANKLQISTEMVKYYLFRARKMIREGMSMERLYGEKSYRPNIFEIDFWGTKAGDDREYLDFQRRKIKGNILLAAYYGPVTPGEISIELGVALPYLEDEINLLLDRRYLVRLFKEKTGMGIQEYIIQVRMEHARTLLQSGFSVNTTASMVGYHDSFNFSKMFKKTTGTSPKQFAQAHRLSEKKG